MWQKLGYQMIGIVPKVARLKRVEVKQRMLKYFSLLLKLLNPRVWWMQSNIIMILEKLLNAKSELSNVICKTLFEKLEETFPGVIIFVICNC